VEQRFQHVILSESDPAEREKASRKIPKMAAPQKLRHGVL